MGKSVYQSRHVKVSIPDNVVNISYREKMSRANQNWIEDMYISATEFGADFDTTFQALNKIYAPVTKSGAKTIALVSVKGFTGKTLTLLEIEMDGAGDPPAATFKWRKKTFLGDTWGAYTEGVATGGNILVTDGIRINFNDTGYAVGNRWHVEGCGSWHTPENGKESFLTSLLIYPLDAAKAAKPGLFRVYSGDYRIMDFPTSKGEFPNWRTPIHLTGDGTTQFRVELAEFTKGDIEHMYCIIKGWDEDSE